MLGMNVVAKHEGKSAKGKEAHNEWNEVKVSVGHLQTEDENIQHKEDCLLDGVLQNLGLRQKVMLLAGQRISCAWRANAAAHHIEDGKNVGESGKNQQLEGVKEALLLRVEIFGQFDI